MDSSVYVSVIFGNLCKIMILMIFGGGTFDHSTGRCQPPWAPIELKLWGIKDNGHAEKDVPRRRALWVFRLSKVGSKCPVQV